MKKEYETVWEIFNECANNQMRDVFFDEIETDDPEAYIRQKFPDKNLKYEKTVEADGSLVFDIETSGIRQRFTFTEIHFDRSNHGCFAIRNSYRQCSVL